MSDNIPTTITTWNPTDVVIIPEDASTPKQIAQYGIATLSKRDISAIVSGFEVGGFEMVSTFVWTKAIAALKKQVATLGMEFVGEMLRRPDLNDDSDPGTSLGDHEALTLAEDLALITPTQGLRLKHAMQLITHFANLDQARAEEEKMEREEAVAILRTCITGILGKEQFDAAVQFKDFRKALTDRTLKPDDGTVAAVLASPYFFKRTTLSVLITTIKSSQGAKLEHAVGNTTLLIPMLWEHLRDSEKWQVGQAYAEVGAAGNISAASALQKALLASHGFDYVPESLRSNTFTDAASRLLSAHFSFNNFYKETERLEELVNLGTTIPMPAFAKAMEAILAVWMGNPYGHTFNADALASKTLKGLRQTQLEYFFDHCLPNDRTVLDKLCGEERPISRWIKFVKEIVPQNITIKHRTVQNLVQLSRAEPPIVAKISAVAKQMRLRILEK